MRCAPRASNGPNHLGLCALSVEEELDAPGEWFLHPTTGLLSLIPPAGVTLDQLQVAALIPGGATISNSTQLTHPVPICRARRSRRRG